MYERKDNNNVSAIDDLSGIYNNTANGANAGTYEKDASSSTFLSKVYGYMAIMLLITFGVAYGLGIPFMKILESAVLSENVELIGTLSAAYLGSLIVSCIGLLVCSIIMSVKAIRSKGNILVPAILYTVFMGLALASTVGVVDVEGSWIIPAVFGICAFMFAVMFFISKVAHNLRWVASVSIGALIGAGMMALLSVILYFNLGLFGISLDLFYIFLLIEVIVFFAILGITLYDVWRVQKIADEGCASKNIALFCAFTLYSDFIYVFLKVLRVVLILVGKSKK